MQRKGAEANERTQTKTGFFLTIMKHWGFSAFWSHFFAPLR